MFQESVWKQRSSQLLSVSRSVLVVVDVQERLLPSIEGRETLVRNIRFLLDAAELFHVKAVATEQYPKGLGPTVPELAGHAGITAKFEKLRFSAAEVLDGSNLLNVTAQESGAQVVLAGIEAHICVQQTALDLVAMGYSVFLPADATGSRHSADYEAALHRMQSLGVIITTAESIAFEWCEAAGSDQFRTLSRLVKERDKA